MKLLAEPRALTEPEYLRFRELVRVKSGIEVPAVRHAELERAVWQMSGELGLSGSDALYGLLLGEERGRLRWWSSARPPAAPPRSMPC
jgi:hypothetical protein